VYDIGDLYKTEISIPIAFAIGRENPPQLERAVRLRCRDLFREQKLLPRIARELRELLGGDEEEAFLPDEDPALPTALWTPDAELVDAGEE